MFRFPLAGHPHKGFTLIEVLTVVTIMAVLAAVVIPQYIYSTEDAKECTLNHNLSVMQAQMELYRMEHFCRYPTIENNSLPQLTNSTDCNGVIGASGPEYPFGPYLVVMPLNPYDGSNKVTEVETLGQKPAGAVGNLGGWQYDKSNGSIWSNAPESYK